MNRILSPDDDLLKSLAALSNPLRLRILAALIQHGRQYVSELARQIGISRPLLYLHLQKLEAAGFVRSELALSDDGKALNWFEICDFEMILSPEVIVVAASKTTEKSPPKE